MDDHVAAAGGLDLADEISKKAVTVVEVIDADPGLGRDRKIDPIADSADAVGDQVGLGHEAGARSGHFARDRRDSRY